MVSIAILVSIMLIVSMIFQRASMAWDAGMRKAELDMTARGVADFAAFELSMAVRDASMFPEFNVGGNTADFWMLGDADPTNRAVRRVTYSGSGGITRDGVALAEGVTSVSFECVPVPSMPGELPRYVDVTVTVTNAYGENVEYQSRAQFANRNRSRF